MARKSNIPISKNSSVLFVTFSRWEGGIRTPTNGSLDPLRDFLVPKVKKLVIIDQPHPGSDRVMPVIEKFVRHKKNPDKFTSSWLVYLLKPLLDKFNISKTQPLFKIRDFLSVIDWALRDKTYFDYCICLESINTLAAILLKKFGRIKKVVYYVSDYSPKRYASSWFNSLYLFLDRFCAEHADYIWDVSKAMQPARIEAGLDPNRSSPAIHVPNGLYPDQIKAYPINKVDKNALVYMGTLTPDNGPDVAIKALALLLKKYKNAKLHIVGGSDKDFLWLEKIVRKSKIEKNIIFHGFIQDSGKMSEVLRSCSIGLAPYRDIPGSIRKYADAGKIRAYCAAGLAVVSSQVPPLGIQVADEGGALITKDTPESFAQAITKLFEDKKLYSKVRKNAILFAKDATWENTFTNAFKRMTV